MLELTDRLALEKQFAEDFSFPLFAVLADIYFKERDYSRSKQVCEIGLKHHPKSVDGAYILAKIHTIYGHYAKAEVLLKHVILYNPVHINAMRFLFEIQKELKRSPNSITKTVELIIAIYPDDKECAKWVLEKDKTIIPQKKEATIVEEKVSVVIEKPQPKKKPKRQRLIQNEIIPISENMASMTLVKVYLTQKHYQQALSVLKMVENKQGRSDKIDKVRVEIKQLVSELEI